MKKDVLDQLATDLVGDGRLPELFFLSENGICVAVLRVEAERALELARSLDRAYFNPDTELLLESRKAGEVWGNEAYYRRQKGEED